VRPVLIAAVVFLTTISLVAIKPDIIRSVGAVPAHIAGRFRNPLGFQQSKDGQYYVFDQRAHTVFSIDATMTTSRQVVMIGAEEGRIIDPTAFAVEPDGTFVVADAPNGRERIQIFSAAGFRIGGFMLPGRTQTRVTLGDVVLNGIGTLQYTGRSILMSQPETGALIVEYTLQGNVNRLIGTLRGTGHEGDSDLHVALNSGIPLVDPRGGFWFVFQTGLPLFQKYDAEGRLVYERRIQGPEIDPVVAALPTTWRRRKIDDREVPLVAPNVRAAAVDGAGNLWISFVAPYTYVYDSDGDKIRALQLRGAGTVAPSSLFFGRNGHLLVTPGLLTFVP
jgi:hypothetical protein